MIWWHLRCSKEHMYIYRYIYTTIQYMYMYIYLYHLSCEPNHVIKPIFHLSVKIKCYPVLHITNDLKTRRLYQGSYHLRVRVRSCPGEAWTCKHLVRRTSPTVASQRMRWEWPCLQDGGHRPPALPAVCTGGGEGGGWSVNKQPENVTERTWKEAKCGPRVACSQNTAKGRMEVSWDEPPPPISFYPAMNELHGQLA